MNAFPPIFIVGMPRSGSTIFHKIMDAHPEVITTTNVSRKAPAHAGLLRLLRKVYRTEKPGELGSMWDTFVGTESDIMEAKDVTEKARRFYRRVLQTHLEVYPGRVFVAKCPRLGMRMGFLKEIFPDARFLHLVRDGRSVCLSVLKMRERDGDRHTWWDAKPANWRELESLEPVASVAHQWNEVMGYVKQCGAELGDDYREFTYEALIRDPGATMQAVGDFCSLACPDPAQQKLLDSLQDRNTQWQDAFSDEEVNKLNTIMAPLLREYGYLSH